MSSGAVAQARRPRRRWGTPTWRCARRSGTAKRRRGRSTRGGCEEAARTRRATGTRTGAGTNTRRRVRGAPVLACVCACARARTRAGAERALMGVRRGHAHRER
eukprot:6049927-Pleurochrysis_carterae.AAC.1